MVLFGCSLVSMVQSSQRKNRTFEMSYVRLKAYGTIYGVRGDFNSVGFPREMRNEFNLTAEMIL